MPLNRLEIFQSPFPMVIGLNLSKEEFKNLSDHTMVKKINKETSKYTRLVSKKKAVKQRLEAINIPNDFIKVFLDFKNFKFHYSEKIRTQFISPKLGGWKKRIMTAYNRYRDKFGLDEDEISASMNICKFK